MVYFLTQLMTKEIYAELLGEIMTAVVDKMTETMPNVLIRSYDDLLDRTSNTFVLLYNRYVKSFPNKQGMFSCLGFSSFKAI